ncbi:undecaprenyldiphospho-muramoylpentapeptide beta-N-acetylglucosaminyltransferase [Brackiella oedipodis]|uniref:undecaprenyldiphospho-muramoylpentapeptide beta-N-acetylglucosaminyltransferase n=1 Tax=Brackiella oedipodis TaxID=124225 RepID=UPI0006885EC6|nr:undecaprenyldiphospho-muramoylpentapeptide beta-N-acetylglucosaminyltransferase [Brackiella oedipodis]
MKTPTLMIMAGGTGGHIMPGLAVAEVLSQKGWRIVWLGNPERMEGRLVPEHGIELQALHFSGLRGKGMKALLKLPLNLWRACKEANQAFKKTQPDVVLGMGGYVSVPGGIVARLKGKPMLIHEQNAVAGTANKFLAKLAKQSLCGFPNALKGAQLVGNPVRQAFLQQASTEQRLSSRTGPLRVMVVGGSLGAKALNDVMPQAMAALAPEQRPLLTHQAGEQHIDNLKQSYQVRGVEANCMAFIKDMAQAMAQVDLIICRAGAMTVAEVAALGVPALFVPLPGAIDDHQTANARWLADAGAAKILKQSEFTPTNVSRFLQECNRQTLIAMGTKARQMAVLNAAESIAARCADYLGSTHET